MTAAVAVALLTLALLDGAFAGFRASAGRTGLINHRQSDQRAARRGAGLVCVLLAPAIAVACAGVLAHPAKLDHYRRAGIAMLAIYGPYALLVLVALACYAALNWRLRYLAAAVILGPFTLLRPGIAVLGAAVAVARGDDVMVAAPEPRWRLSPTPGSGRLGDSDVRGRPADRQCRSRERQDAVRGNPG
jgi:hypothetical protein